eukprot:GHVR01009839.1.p1 GENE.GHVR01009839.1~~GHVR01009839.1.p1  ORF type:complete len:506 (-),score=172.20 GHVR01009839.1:40-1503(-)
MTRTIPYVNNNNTMDGSRISIVTTDDDDDDLNDLMHHMLALPDTEVIKKFDVDFNLWRRVHLNLPSFQLSPVGKMDGACASEGAPSSSSSYSSIGVSKTWYTLNMLNDRLKEGGLQTLSSDNVLMEFSCDVFITRSSSVGLIEETIDIQSVVSSVEIFFEISTDKGDIVTLLNINKVGTHRTVTELLIGVSYIKFTCRCLYDDFNILLTVGNPRILVITSPGGYNKSLLKWRLMERGKQHAPDEAALHPSLDDILGKYTEHTNKNDINENNNKTNIDLNIFDNSEESSDDDDDNNNQLLLLSTPAQHIKNKMHALEHTYTTTNIESMGGRSSRISWGDMATKGHGSSGGGAVSVQTQTQAVSSSISKLKMNRIIHTYLPVFVDIIVASLEEKLLDTTSTNNTNVYNNNDILNTYKVPLEKEHIEVVRMLGRGLSYVLRNEILKAFAVRTEDQLARSSWQVLIKRPLFLYYKHSKITLLKKINQRTPY